MNNPCCENNWRINEKSMRSKKENEETKNPELNINKQNFQEFS